MTNQDADGIVKLGETTVRIERPESQVVVVYLAGAIGMTESSRLLDYLEQVVTQAPRLLIMDLSELQFVTSMGLGTFISTRSKLAKLGGTLLLVSPSKHVLEVLEITNLTKLFPVFSSVEQALQSSADKDP